MSATEPTTERSYAFLAAGALLIVTAAWGSTFFLIKDLVEVVPPVDFLAVRFAIAAAALFLLRPRAVLALGGGSLRRGVVLGLVYGGAQILQTVGLAHTAASVSGFVTGMYVVFTPILAALVLRQRIGATVWIAVAVATAGLAFLSLEGLAIGYGEGITLLSAVLYALHIVMLGAWTSAREAYALAVVQMAVIAVLCFAISAPGGIVLPQTGGQWVSMVYMALVAGAFAMLAQTWAQAHLPATRAAIIMSMEPVFAAAFAIGFTDESLTVRTLAGGGLVLAAMLLAEAAPRRHIEAEVPHLSQ
ncbi:DMT family transporter [Mumia sp. ZJ1417]|uniref:DMT family transporter n=1 Tax=unclassified Mumia TaxID=2621872 RepID=UPI0014240128|nr:MULTISPECIES: DMT family transporter [unclassified Mumia]QMW67749.1 DMT family transporter [Mumia sp. ZJ1417]